MINNSEKDVENSIKDYINMTWWICKRLNSWKIVLSSQDKFWKIKYRAVKLEDEWTTDLVAETKWKTYWIEVKKNKDEYDKWLSLEARFIKWEKLPKSYVREESQIKEKIKIVRRWWNHILTYSLVDLISKIW